MRIQPQSEGVSIVLVGNFNPSIFTPAWFGLNNLLSASQVSSADLKLAHRDFTEFSLDWLHVTVTMERFTAETTQAPYIRVHDLVFRTFNELLNHTPLRALGINQIIHFPVKGKNELDRIGRKLAPLEPWGTWGGKLNTVEEFGGLSSLTMSQMALKERPVDDQLNVKVEPSQRIKQSGGYGVFVEVNDHYTAGNVENAAASKTLMNKLNDFFEESLSRSNILIDQLMSLSNE